MKATEKYDQALKEALERALREDPRKCLPVIVTCRAGCWDVDALRRQGMLVHGEFPSILAVAGAVPAEQLEGIASLEAVEKIEYDGQVDAL